MALVDWHQAGAAFDGLASRYDELWTRSTVGRLQRDAVWRRLDSLFRPGDSLLDLGCGTGEDPLHFAELGIDEAAIAQGADLTSVVGLLKDRASTVKEIAENAAMFYRTPAPEAEALAQHVTDVVRPALADLAASLKTVEWTKEAIAAALKATLGAHKLKMPQLAMPVRLLVAGTTHTPSIDSVLMLFGRDVVVSRIEKALA